MTTSCQTVAPLTIHITDAALEDLQVRLDRTRWPDVVDGSSWRHGTALEYVRDLAQHWRTGFDWRTHEVALNELPHFVTVLDGQPVHFLHVRSSQPAAQPLLLIHGWPGSFVELLDLIGPLTEPEQGSAFDVVIPSIPGFALSGPRREHGWTVRRIALAFTELMSRLGYQRFGVQGGDWGAVIAADLGRCAPDQVIGVHVNAVTAGFIPSGLVDPVDVPAAERARLARLRDFRATGSAFFALQATRPQTLAYGLADSPAGLLAWIGEKFHDCSHDPTRIDRDRLLTNVALHWFTGTANSAALIYYEYAHTPLDLSRSRTPTGVAVFAEDLAIRASAEQHNTIVRWTELDCGGHFAALEEPDLLAADVGSFFTDLTHRSST